MALAGAGLWLVHRGIDRSKRLHLPIAFTIASTFALDLVFAHYPKPGHMAVLGLGYLISLLVPRPD